MFLYPELRHFQEGVGKIWPTATSPNHVISRYWASSFKLDKLIHAWLRKKFQQINMLASMLNLYLNNEVLQLVADTRAAQIIHPLQVAWVSGATERECLYLSTHLKLQLHKVRHGRDGCIRTDVVWYITISMLSHNINDFIYLWQHIT